MLVKLIAGKLKQNLENVVMDIATKSGDMNSSKYNK